MMSSVHGLEPIETKREGELQTLILMMSSVHGLEPMETKRGGVYKL